MIKSMTGYGAAEGTAGGAALSIELRTVNARHLDVAAKMPRRFLFAEESIKKRISRTLARGKVDVFLTIADGMDEDNIVTVNEPLAAAYFAAFESLAQKFSLKCDITAVQLGRLPDVLSVRRQSPDAEIFTAQLLAILDAALTQLQSMRQTEGARLSADITTRLTRVEELTVQIETRSPETVTAYRAKLMQRMTAVLEDRQLDENRILLEAAVFADRVAVDEEITRLNSHVAQFRAMLNSENGEAVGRKLDFLLQELGREANTIGSKCNDSATSGLVIELKAELEKIREQVQNIE